MSAKQVRETRRIELVETHNIALSIARMNPQGWDGLAWRRALYHAAAMSGIVKTDTLRKLRDALELP